MMLTGKLARVFGLAVLFAAGCSATGTDGDGAPKEISGDAETCLTPEDLDRMSGQLVQLTNLERASAGLPPVTRVEPLDRLAADYACRMIEEGFFAHHDPATGEGPGARAARVNYRYYFVGENLAAGQTSAAEVMREWLASPEHREIILSSKWTEIGVGVRAGGIYGLYWVVEFAQPARRPATPTETAPAAVSAVADAEAVNSVSIAETP
ncbi:MAG: hypothetical protein BroJett003_19570 [Planctomycetota bacterium]|nr:MAG: hypothetical protein BroJett003_19570 [Planctomycetota bacterium]